MIDTIKLSGLRAFGYHGVLDFEKEQGQEFMVDVEITTDFSTCVASDNVADTVNYAEVAQIVVASVTQQRFDLIESLAHSIAAQVAAMAGVQSATITIHKPHAPVAAQFNDISVTTTVRAKP